MDFEIKSMTGSQGGFRQTSMLLGAYLNFYCENLFVNKSGNLLNSNLAENTFINFILCIPVQKATQ